MSGAKVVKLKYPVTIDREGEPVKELVFERRPKAKDMRGLNTNLTMDDMFLLLGRLSNQPTPVILELDVEDMAEAMKVMADFLPGSLRTGSMASA